MPRPPTETVTPEVLFPGIVGDVRTPRRGHAAAPGSGPKGKTCRTCEHYRSVQSGARTHPKCILMRHHWTGGPGSDIRARDAACWHYEERAI